MTAELRASILRAIERTGGPQQWETLRRLVAAYITQAGGDIPTSAALARHLATGDKEAAMMLALALLALETGAEVIGEIQ